MMLLWWVPLVFGLGLLAYPSWRREAAIRSGELMDVRVAALGDGKLATDLYARERDLRDLFALACRTRSSAGRGRNASPTLHRWGSVPLLEFESSTLGRIRFELSIDPNEGGTVRGVRYVSRLDKAWLVLKEDVRKLPVSAAMLDSLAVDLQARRLIRK